MTAFQAEGCGGGFAADYKKGGAAGAAGCVEGLHRYAQGATAASPLRVVVAPFGAQIIKKPAPIPVISTVAGQPPIGKPLIVQARGQLRLTWRLYAESPQSGEIPSSDGTGGITAGDLSTQSIIKAFSICPIPTCSPARDDGGSGHHWTHLRCEGSQGSEGKVLRIDRPYGSEGS